MSMDSRANTEFVQYLVSLTLDFSHFADADHATEIYVNKTLP